MEKKRQLQSLRLEKCPGIRYDVSTTKTPNRKAGQISMAYDSTILQRLQGKREAGLSIAASLTRIGERDRALMLLQCGTYIGMIDDGEGGVKIAEANFCRERLCPSCSWRRSLKIYSATSQILDYLDKQPAPPKYLFLTLTVRNVALNDIGPAVSMMADAYKRLTNNRAWRRRVQGAMRTLEVTIDQATMTAHPHYHLILAVDRSYATKSDDTYWTHQDWMRAWRHACRLDYDPSVRIEAVRGRRQGIAEVSKYMTKSADLLCPSDPDKQDQIIQAIHQGMAGRRLISYTGTLHKAQRALMLDPETAPLVDEVRGDIAAAVRKYHWSAGLGCYVPGARD